MTYETLHPLDSKDAAAMQAMRTMIASHPMALTRASFDELIGRRPGPEGMTYEAGEVAGVPGMWCRPANAHRQNVSLYLHGGAYVMGSANAYKQFAGHFAARTQTTTFVPDYRLAPENPFPAAIDDVRAVYRSLAATNDGKIAVMGDSAGGGLTLALLASAVAEAKKGGPRAPVAGVAFSAWVDLALVGDSIETRAKDDPLLSRAALHGGASQYLKGRDAKDPLASPLVGDLAGLPPILLHVGTAEVLLDDSRRFAARAAQANVDVTLHTWEGMPHVFLSNLGMFVAAEEAVASSAEFLRKALAY